MTGIIGAMRIEVETIKSLMENKTSETVSKCMIDGHYIGYVQCFTNWCLHWATNELKWIGGDSE